MHFRQHQLPKIAKMPRHSMRYLSSLALVGLLLGLGAFAANAQQKNIRIQPPQPSTEPKELSPLPPKEQLTRVLSWDDCVALAAQRNPTLTAAEYAKNASRFSYYSSYNALLPNLSLSNTLTRVEFKWVLPTFIQAKPLPIGPSSTCPRSPT
jgi:hypothetical protein